MSLGDSLKKGSKALRMQKKLKEDGILDIRLVEEFLEANSEEGGLEDLSLLAEMINHELDQLEELCDRADIDHEPVGRFQMDQIREVFASTDWLNAVHIIAKEYSNQKQILIEALGEEIGLSESEIEELV